MVLSVFIFISYFLTSVVGRVTGLATILKPGSHEMNSVLRGSRRGTAVSKEPIEEFRQYIM